MPTDSDEEAAYRKAFEQSLASEQASALNEMRRDALQNIFPSPREIIDRIKLATHLSGRFPNVYKGFLARAELQITDAWIRAVESDTDSDAAINDVLQKLDAEQYMKEHAPSIGGERAKQAVQIASVSGIQQRRRKTVGQWLRGE